MTMQDQVIGALTMWRENRGGGQEGMTSVLNVLMNRAKARGTSVYTEAVRAKQFSSMTEPGDVNLVLFPQAGDQEWQEALALAAQASAGTLEDITGGSLSYYAESMKEPPYWAKTMEKTVIIGGQIFFK